LVLYPFFPVFYVGTNHRGDILLTEEAQRLFDYLQISDKYMLGRERERVLKIIKTFYTNYE
jgi:hypothetical protein